MRVILMTCPPDQAESLLNTLLEERLVACGNIVPLVRSRYWWEGRICADDESLVVMETAAERWPALEARLTALHPYQVPKIVALDPAGCNAPYLAWLRATTLPAPQT